MMSSFRLTSSKLRPPVELKVRVRTLSSPIARRVDAMLCSM